MFDVIVDKILLYKDCQTMSYMTRWKTGILGESKCTLTSAAKEYGEDSLCKSSQFYPDENKIS